MSLYTSIHGRFTHSCFWDVFFGPPKHVQTTRSPGLFNGSWWFLVQNEGEVLLVSFLLSVVFGFHLKRTKNFQLQKFLKILKILKNFSNTDLTGRLGEKIWAMLVLQGFCLASRWLWRTLEKTMKIVTRILMVVRSFRVRARWFENFENFLKWDPASSTTKMRPIPTILQEVRDSDPIDKCVTGL